MTQAAYEAALDLPIHGVECDVRLTSDGHLVCLHDATLVRVAKDPAVVSRSTLAQLRSKNIGNSEQPQRVLTLEELVEMVRAYPGKHLYIETKHPSRHGRHVERAVAEVLRAKRLDEDPRMHLISFSHAAIRRAQRLVPMLDTVYLRRDWERRWNPGDTAFSRPQGRGLSLAMAKLHPELVQERTYLYTVNEPEDIAWALAHEVDMLATDAPDVALRVLGGRAAAR